MLDIFKKSFYTKTVIIINITFLKFKSCEENAYEPGFKKE